MQFKFHLGTKVLFGKDCIKLNKSEFLKYGKKAVIVTGKSSGKSSGALNDVVAALEENEIQYLIYDNVENNPTLENVKEGGLAAASFNAGFVIGIGGGSPLDAAKAIAVLAVNSIEPLELYKNEFTKVPLPIIAIPTTAGTGSEVTPYSILTRSDLETKMSFGNDDTFPKVAFMDASYTESMPYNVTVNTAVDALSHAMEGYLSKRSTPASDLFAVESMKIFGECIENLIQDKFDFDVREKLLYMAILGGMVISHTGTTVVHGMGYSLTYFKDIPHGMANGLLLAEYLKFNYDFSKEKIDNVLQYLKVNDFDEFDMKMRKMMPSVITLSHEELNRYAAITMKQRSTGYNIKPVTEDDIIKILDSSMNK